MRILVCGRGDRGDDGAALSAVARLLPSLPRAVCDRIEVRRSTQLDVTDLLDLGAGEACLILDTLTGIPPGEIVVLPLVALAGVADGPAARSAHEVPLSRTIERATVVRGSALAGSLVGIGGKWFGYGERTSRVLRSALPTFVEAIRVELDRLLSAAPVG